MKNVSLKAIVAAFYAMIPIGVNSQLYEYASGSTAVIVRDPARQTSTDIDAAIYNSAGTAFLAKGLHFSLNGHLELQKLDSFEKIDVFVLVKAMNGKNIRAAPHSPNST